MQNSARSEVPPLSPDGRFQHVAVDLLGRFMLEDQREFPCRVESMSPGDLAVATPVTPREGERIILYVDHVGRIEGAVNAVFQGGYSMDIAGTERRREKLAAQLTWLANRHELDLPEDRRHERIQPGNPMSPLTLPDEKIVQVRIIDLSLSGAAVRAAGKPPIGSRVALANIRGRVVRHLEDGFAIEFAAVQQRDTLEATFR